MKSRILYGVMGMALVALLIGGGTYAYFSDTETSTGNTFSAGTLDLTVNNTNPWTGVTFDLANMAPGTTEGPVTFTLKNDGSLTGDLYITFKDIQDGGGTAAYPTGDPKVSSEPEYVAEGMTWNGNAWTGTLARIDNISTKLAISTCTYNGTNVTNALNHTLSEFNTTSLSYVLLQEDWGPTDTGTLDLAFTLDGPTTGNEYQGDECTFTIEFYLAQDGQPHP